MDQVDHQSVPVVTTPAYHFSDSGRQLGLYFSRVISFFPPTDFSTSLNRLSRNLPHDVACSEIIDYVIYRGVHAPKNLRSEKPHFCQFADPKLTLLAPPFPNARETGKSKRIGSICD